MAIITFTDITKIIPNEYAPKPASHFIPDWYKDLNSFIDNKKIPDGKGQTSGTIKKCMPVFDAITAGYILVTPADIFVSQKLEHNHENNKNTIPFFEWANFGLIDFHAVEQAPNHPYRNEHTSYPKLINPWSISTAKGYSVMFVQPFHRKSIFTILPGIVDTDTYNATVNFPFVLNDIKFEGLIPAGTPMAQVIPFKRENYKMQFGAEKNLQNHYKHQMLVRTKFFDAYKNMFRIKKEYK